MIILDTNVVSETMRARPHPEVIAWLDDQPTETLYVTALTEAEIMFGISILPEGRRRAGLEIAADQAFNEIFANRTLPFDSSAAQHYALVANTRRASGHPISQFDCQIAAIARSVGASVATRDVSGFAGCGINLMNPWPQT